jgi:hypothetical protein
MNEFVNHLQQAPAKQNKIGINDTTEVVCERCGCNVFTTGTYMRKVSAFLTGTGKPAYIPIEQAVYCVKCSHVNDEFIPAELKSKVIVP